MLAFPLCVLSGAGLAGAAATINVINNDGAGEGFNDPTGVAPVGGNPGTTLGAQRLNAFEFAAEIWADLITSDVEIRLAAEFNPLFCDPNVGAVLALAGAAGVDRDFAGAPVAATFYPAALADKLAGMDLFPPGDDVGAEFNSSIGTTCTLAVDWYYGLDASPGFGEVDFVTTVLHELGHGLGFATFVDDTTGEKFLGFDDVFMLQLEDHSTGELWPDMSDAERVTSSTDPGDLHWVGAEVVAASGSLSDGVHASGHVEMFAPSTLDPGSSVSHFSDDLDPDGLMEPFETGALHDVGLALELFADLDWCICGNGVVEPPELCDDGNSIDDDFCSNDCQGPPVPMLPVWGRVAGALLLLSTGIVLLGQHPRRVRP
ncbi:MAG: hypothetical protein O7B29_12045 [Deltaproteobacteria bacterium]|nr:hypothetical protein [Deltaproteobacteria bacterium]